MKENITTLFTAGTRLTGHFEFIVAILLLPERVPESLKILDLYGQKFPFESELCLLTKTLWEQKSGYE